MPRDWRHYAGSGRRFVELEARLACVEAFVPGVRGSGRRIGVAYFPSRALLSKLAEKLRSPEDKPLVGRS